MPAKAPRQGDRSSHEDKKQHGESFHQRHEGAHEKDGGEKARHGRKPGAGDTPPVQGS